MLYTVMNMLYLERNIMGPLLSISLFEPTQGLTQGINAIV